VTMSVSRPARSVVKVGRASRQVRRLTHFGFGQSVTEWLSCSVLAGALISAVDAALIQRKRGIFTGGFLAADQLDRLSERVAFALLSVLSDAALASVLIVVAYALARRLGLRTTAARTLAVSCAAAPFLIADAFSYEMFRYLGDAFDLGLMFDLTGRSTGEILAVSSGHLMARFASVMIGAAGIAVLTLVVQRFFGGASTAVRTPWLLPAALLVVGGGAHLTARLQVPALDEALRRKPSGEVFGWAAESLTDFDRDGYGMLGRPPDPAPFDSSVYPYAIDWPGNGIDEDGIGGDLRPSAPYVEGGGPIRWRQRPPVVLIVLESFRADAVGARVNGRTVTPALDRLAAAGVSSSRAFSHNGYTAQSRFHLLTGSLAGLRGGTSLIDDFKFNGYDVGYISGQDDSFGGREFAVGMERADVAFDARSAPQLRYSTFSTAGSLAVPAAVVEDQIARFLARRDRAKPLFLYVNLHDTHFPYHHDGIEPLVSNVVLRPSDITPERASELRQVYLNTAANVDAAIGRILDAVQAHLGTAPGVIVTGDHGESLFDEGFLGHGYALNDAQTRVPLIVANLPLTIEEPFGQADLRDMIGSALEREATPGLPPVITASPSKAVFQYLGLLDRPRAIATVQGNSRASIDLRSLRRETGSGPQVDLIHRWESMILARHGAEGASQR